MSLGRKSRHSDLYIANFALLIAHEIDSAYWHEWDLFGLPGGIQLFVALHVVLGALGLLGLRWLLVGARSGQVVSLVLAAAGVFAFAAHAYFISAGRPEFTLPVSVALLAAILCVSLAQGVVAVRSLQTEHV